MKKFKVLKKVAGEKIEKAKYGMLSKTKPGISTYVEVILLVLVAVVVGAVFMRLSNTGMETLFEDMIDRITSGFTG